MHTCMCSICASYMHTHIIHSIRVYLYIYKQLMRLPHAMYVCMGVCVFMCFVHTYMHTYIIYTYMHTYIMHANIYISGRYNVKL